MRRSFLFKVLLKLGVIGAPVLFVMPAMANDSDKKLRGIEEIVVTARRSEERLQDVPVAVSAFDAKQIKERGIETEADLQMSTPGLQVRVTNSSNQLNYSIRGQTVDGFSFSQPAVLAYVNEVQAGGVSVSSFFDMASVQVLKGPQGTLFGRNATGGSVLYQTKKPDDELGGYIKAGFGNYSNEEIEGAINIPFNDQIAMRVAGLKRTRDGWQDNLYNGDELASIDTENFRLSLSYTGDKLENHFMGYYAEQGGKTEGLRVRNSYTCLTPVSGVCAPGGGEANPNTGIPVGETLFANLLYPEGILSVPGALDIDNPRLIELGQQLGFSGFESYINAVENLDLDQVLNDQSNDSEIRQKLFTNTTIFEINDSMTVKNIIGYGSVEAFQSTDIDGSPFMMLRMGDENDNGEGGGYDWRLEQISNELQLSGELLGGDLTYITGMYYYYETSAQRNPIKFIADYTTDPFGPAFVYHGEHKDESKSIFSQFNYALTEKFNLTLGGRYTWEQIDFQHLPESLFYISNGVTDQYTQKVERPSWLASLDYRINDENMVYISTRGSWRTGGYNFNSINDLDGNPATADVPDEYKPEKTWDIEAGWKFSGLIGDMPARINVAAYQQSIEDVQRTVYLNITSQTGNVEESEVTGVEVDVQLDLRDWLEVGGAFAWTDAEFTKPLGDVIGFNHEFGPYADAPEYQWSIYFFTQKYIDGMGNLTFRGDYYSNDDTYFSNLNDSIGPGSELDSYELLNFRVALEEVAGTGITAVAFVRNATNEEYERGGLPLGGVTATNATIVGEPRTYGFELTYQF